MVSKHEFWFRDPEKLRVRKQIIGAGVVGLAIARKLADQDGTSTLLIERHRSSGTETSSRNSEVRDNIHIWIFREDSP